jgi:threonine-phosphate decarboxylase
MGKGWLRMASMLGFGNRTGFREVIATLPDKPVSLPYELRTEMTWLDFCNPVNPLGTPKSIVQAMHTALVDGELNYTPDQEGHAFRDHIGDYLGLDSDWILVGASATQMIMHAALAFPPATVGVVTPCPAEYITAVGNAGHDFLELENTVSFATIDAYTARAEIGDFDGVVLGNPAYPTSRLLPRQTIIHYLETCTWVIVDESNIELSFGAESTVPLTDRYHNLIVVRNPSTTFGMPGVPISYAVAHPDTIARIRQTYDGGDVSMFVEVLARQFVIQQEYLDQTHEFLDKEIPWMQCMISLIPGISIYPAEGNFVLCEFNPAEGMRLGVTCAEELIIRLQLAGFLVRPLAGMPGLAGDGFFCVCVKTREENERLLDAMRRIINTID